MSIARPTATFALDGSGPGLLGGPLDLAQAGVRRCSIELSVDEAHDRVEVTMWKTSVLADAEPGSSLTIGLGADGDPEDVLTVDVAGVDAGSDWATLVGFAPSRRLSSTYVGRAYVSQTLADVVNDLLSEGGVDAGDIDATLSFPAIHIDPRRSVWGHLHELGRRFGHQVTSDADGAISFAPAPGVSPAGGLASVAAAVPIALPFGSDDLREGAELLSFRAGKRQVTGSTAGVSPAGSRAWFLLESSPDSGSGDPVDVAPLLRTRDAADAATQAAQAAAKRRSARLRARVTGRPSLRAGSVVPARGESHRLLRVRHLVDVRAGYVCDIVMEGAG